jgi:hypothetical protein
MILVEQMKNPQKNSSRETKLDELSKKYCADPDGLEVRMQAFARKHELVQEAG